MSNVLTKEDVISLIYQAESDTLSKKVLDIFLQQQKRLWVGECYNKEKEIASKIQRDLEECSK